MTRRDSYIRKYGPVEGPEKLRLLGTNAALPVPKAGGVR